MTVIQQLIELMFQFFLNRNCPTVNRANVSILFKQKLARSPWKEHKTDTGETFYVNSQTKETTSTKPQELKDLEGTETMIKT